MRYLLFLFLTTMLSCKSNTVTQNQEDASKKDENLGPTFKPIYTPGPRALIFKTKEENFNLVPILLSKDKKSIVSYPHPKDVKSGDKYLTPSLLKQGYLLDNKGIGANVAFINLTYKEYSELESVPALDKMLEMISDRDPLLELCDCGNRTAFTNIEAQLNELIESGKLRSTCKVIK